MATEPAGPSSPAQLSWRAAFCVVIIVWLTMQGLLFRPLAPETYPAKLEFIKRLG